MEKMRNKVAVALVCIILGIILAIQFKTVKNTSDGIIPTQRAQQLANELKRLQEEREKLREEIDNLEYKVKQYEEDAAGKDVFLENLYKDLQKYKMLAGYEDVKGPGVVIEISEPNIDGENTSILIDNYDILLQVISILNAGDAEAISINDQRYTSYTEIERAGNHIEINGVSFSSPFVIKAIGNPDTLESAMRIKGGYVEGYLKNILLLDVQINKKEHIKISKYRNIEEFKYAEPDEKKSN